MNYSHVAGEIEKALLAAGYEKRDPLSEDLTMQLKFALKDFREDMKKVARTVELFKFTDEKAEFILRALEAPPHSSALPQGERE